jgi:predicted metal-dependent hydrolase
MTALPSSSNTPEGVSIKARNMSFKIEQALATDWADNDAFLTAIFNAMSISFPSGEKNFIDSVRVYQDRIEDPKLRSEVKGFFKQEGIHSREHRKYNQLLCQQRGYDLEKLEGVYLNRIEASKNDPKITNRVMLASTVAVEHFTASFGESFLQGKLVKNVDGPLGDLWRWHSLEELEHKSVAFDVYRQIGGDNKMRTTVMRLSMMTLFWDVMKVAIKILRHDQQLWKWKTVKSMAKFLFSKQGFIRIHVPAYKAFFRDDFHPWDIDNRPLLEHWQEKLTPVMAAA